MDAYNAYDDDLLHSAQQNNLPDLDSSYARLAEKALRVAMLVASLENGNHVELSHWSLGYAIAEQWRANLHTLYDQLNANTPPPAKEPAAEIKLEDRLVAIVRKHPRSSATDVARYVQGLSPIEAHEILGNLVLDSRLSCTSSGRTLRYEINDERNQWAPERLPKPNT
jgi:hypothetical protein